MDCAESMVPTLMLEVVLISPLSTDSLPRTLFESELLLSDDGRILNAIMAAVMKRMPARNA